jgi:TonB family protein
MTLQRSLYISLTVHILIFGSAIAFAQLLRGTPWSYRDAIIVSLVDFKEGSAGRTSQRTGQHETNAESRSVPHRTSAPSIQRKIRDQVQTTQEAASLSTIQEQIRGGADDTDAGQKSSGTGPALGPSAGFGLVTTEQWAVIESAIERSKAYPRMARERGIQGVVHVRFKLKPSGEIDRVEIVKSSGYDILDSASIRTLYRVGPLPYVNGWVEVPMAYVLK